MKLHYVTSGSSEEKMMSNLKEALKHNPDWVQIRIKDISDEEYLKRAQKLIDIIPIGITVILNDRYHLVSKLGVDGVHVGQSDGDFVEIRNVLGSDKILGVTANTKAHLDKGLKANPTYFGVGPYRFTETKKKLSPILGLDGIVDLKVYLKENNFEGFIVPIGGITFDDFKEIEAKDIDWVALSSAMH